MESLKGIILGAVIGAAATIVGSVISWRTQRDLMVTELKEENLRRQELLLLDAYNSFIVEYGFPQKVWRVLKEKGSPTWDNYNIHILKMRLLSRNDVADKMDELYGKIPKSTSEAGVTEKMFIDTYYEKLKPVIESMSATIR